jgi:hypothetical protein
LAHNVTTLFTLSIIIEGTTARTSEFLILLKSVYKKKYFNEKILILEYSTKVKTINRVPFPVSAGMVLFLINNLIKHLII